MQLKKQASNYWPPPSKRLCKTSCPGLYGYEQHILHKDQQGFRFWCLVSVVSQMFVANGQSYM